MLEATESEAVDQPIIRVENVYKRYRRNEQQVRTLRHDTMAMVKGWIGKSTRQDSPEVEPFYALQDISFGVEKGEAVGDRGAERIGGRRRCCECCRGLRGQRVGVLKCGGDMRR